MLRTMGRGEQRWLPDPGTRGVHIRGKVQGGCGHESVGDGQGHQGISSFGQKNTRCVHIM
jgi:hypothetical protein